MQALPRIALDKAEPAPLETRSSGPSDTKADLTGRESAEEYVVDHRLNPNGTTSYRIRWYGYGPSGDTWERPEHIPHHFVPSNCDRETARFRRNHAARRPDQDNRRAGRQDDNSETTSRVPQMTRAERLSTRQTANPRASQERRRYRRPVSTDSPVGSASNSDRHRHATPRSPRSDQDAPAHSRQPPPSEHASAPRHVRHGLVAENVNESALDETNQQPARRSP